MASRYAYPIPTSLRRKSRPPFDRQYHDCLLTDLGFRITTTTLQCLEYRRGRNRPNPIPPIDPTLQYGLLTDTGFTLTTTDLQRLEWST